MNMKTNTQIKLRSVFSSGMNLGNQIHRTKKGKGSYVRKNRNNKWYWLTTFSFTFYNFRPY